MAEMISLITFLSFLGWFYVNQPHDKPCMGEVRRVALATLSSGANSPA